MDVLKCKLTAWATRSATVGISGGPGSTIVLWYVHPSHRRRKVAARRLPIADSRAYRGCGAKSGWGCTHLSGALVSSGNFQHRGLHFCGSCRRRRRDKRVIRDCSKQRQVRRAASVLSLRQRPHQLISGSVIGTVTIILHSAARRPDGGTNLEKRQ